MNSQFKQTVFLALVVALLAISQTGCISMSTLQTAQTLEKGKTQTTYGGGYYQSPSFNKAVNNDDLKAPFLEFSYREGITKNWDYGLKLTIIGSVVADAKYQLIDQEKFDLSTGLGIGYFSMTSGSGTTEYKTTAIDAIVPVYASYQFTDIFALYASPRYMFRSISGTSSSSASYAGGGVGTKIGKEWGVFLEGTYLKELGGNFDSYQYNISLFFNGSGGILSTLGI